MITAKNATLAGVGLLFVWSAFGGLSVSGSLRDVLAGGKPKGNNVNPITGAGEVPGVSGTATGGSSGVSASNSDIANDVMQYNGDPYGWGKSTTRTADCSGLVNQVCGRDLGLPIPGYPNGKYSGHGPVTQQWYIWNGLQTISKSSATAGDIICWPTHMGIVLGPNKMISALNPALGTRVTTFAGGSPFMEVFKIRRYK